MAIINIKQSASNPESNDVYYKCSLAKYERQKTNALK